MKNKLLERLHELIDLQISNSKNAMDAAQESAMSDGKSSAGDKFETSRAMGHRDRDMYANQLALALNEKAILYKINTETDHQFITLGSLVETTLGIFFISISMGKIQFENGLYFAVSPQAPVCKDMIGKSVGDTFLVNGKGYGILGVR